MVNLDEVDQPVLNDFLNTDVLVICLTPSMIGSVDMDFLVKAIKAANIKQIILTSSTAVYASSDEIITEESELIDNKAHQFERWFSPLSELLVVLRLAGLIGEDRHPGNFLNPNKVYNGGLNNVNLIHRDDVIQIIERVISEKTIGTVINCCADKHPTKAAFYNYATAQVGNPNIHFESNTLNNKLISNKKLKERYDYQFKYADPYHMI